MLSNREQKDEVMLNVKERSEYEYGEYSARNEYNEKQYGSDGVGDLDALLYNTREADSLKTASVPAPKAKDYADTTDAMPSTTTMQFRSKGGPLREELPIDRNIYTYELDNARPDTDEDRQYRISTRGKVLIAVYALVVVTIFALIMLNTRLLRNLNNDVAVMEMRIEALNRQNEELDKELDFVSDDAQIEKKAQEMGMVK